MHGHDEAEDSYAAPVKRFPKHLLAALPVMALLSVGMMGAELLGWLEPLQRASLDIFLRAEQQPISHQIYLVTITDADYEKYFNSTSPLDPCTVIELVNRVAGAGPAVIGVDLDTSSKDYANLHCTGGQHSSLEEREGTEVVWALAPPGNEKNSAGRLEFANPSVLGRPYDRKIEAGIPVFPVDGDGAVRKYQAEFDTNIPSGENTQHSTVESLGRAVAMKYRKGHLDAGEEGILRYAGKVAPFPLIQADEFLHDAADPAFGKPDWSALKERIVLIGGTYRAARDSYATPVGTRAGVELIAYAVQSDLNGGGIHEGSRPLAFALDLLAGTILVFTYFLLEHRHYRWAFWISMIEVPLLSVIGSVWVFRSKAFWFDFAPVVLGMLVHQLFETGKKHRETREELEAARAQIEELRKPPQGRGATGE